MTPDGSTTPDVWATDMSDGLRATYVGRFEKSLESCVDAGPPGAALLSDALDTLTGFRRVLVAAALGDMEGPGTAALRRAVAVTGPGTADLRNASLLALGKREQGRATADLVAALADPVTASYALLSLARFGDGSAWAPVFDAVHRRLRRAKRAREEPWTSVLYGLAYLARSATDDVRRREVALLVARHGARLDDSERDVLGAWGLLGEAAGHDVDWDAVRRAVERDLRADPLFHRMKSHT